MGVNRELLLHQLESVIPGLSVRDIIEQSSCFVFKEGRVITYNDEITCSCKCVLGIEGAVDAKPLREILQKLTEEEVEVEMGESELIIRGRKRSAGIRMEKEILLPLDHLEVPAKGDWKDLPKDFTEAVNLVKDCASSDQSMPKLTCVHLTSTHIEASDNFQVARYHLKLPLKQSVLVKQESLRCVLSLDMMKFAETDNWVHFRSGSGVVLSCRRFEESFPDTDKHLELQGGVEVMLPKGLPEAVEKARVFSSDTSGDEQIRVSIRPGKFRIRGEGTSGWFTEFSKTNYKGSPISFLIAPDLLVNIMSQTNKCEVGDRRLRVQLGKFTYVTALGEDSDA